LDNNEDNVTHLYLKYPRPVEFEETVPELLTGKVCIHLPRIPVEIMEFSDVEDAGLVKWVRPVLITIDFNDVVYPSKPVVEMLEKNSVLLAELFTLASVNASTLDPAKFKDAMKALGV